MRAPYVELRAHSGFSFGNGVMTPEARDFRRRVKAGSAGQARDRRVDQRFEALAKAGLTHQAHSFH